MPHNKLNTFEAISLENFPLSSYEIINVSKSTTDVDKERFQAAPFSIKIVRSNLIKAIETSVWLVSMLSKLSENKKWKHWNRFFFSKLCGFWMISYCLEIALFFRPMGHSVDSIRASGRRKRTKCSNFVYDTSGHRLHIHLVRWPSLSIYVCFLCDRKTHI